MDQIFILLSFIFPFLGIVLWALLKLVFFIRNQRKPKNIFQFAFEIVTVPFHFSKIFLQKRKEFELPLYFQYFLRFTRFCSQIPYFHFLPKFVVATIAEFLIHLTTHEPLLTALIFTWSFFFFITITIVESMYGEFEEVVITLANKIFLFSVSVMTLFSLFMWLFFWPEIEKFLNNGFFHFMSKVAEFSNEKFLEAALGIWNFPLPIKILMGIMLGLYVSGSLYLSKKGIK